MQVKENLRVDMWDLELANELIEVEELDIVGEYLRKCQRLGLWQTRDLQNWIDALESGKNIRLD